MSKIAIVTAYADRKPQLAYTLKTLAQSKHKDFSLYIVQDVSSPEHDLKAEDFEPYSFAVKLVKVDVQKRWWHNPCVPFNVAFDLAAQDNPDIFLIQNPECCHVGDVLSYADTVPSDSYHCFAAYALSEQWNQVLWEHGPNSIPFHLEYPWTSWSGCGWYSHPDVRPAVYHFCSALGKDAFEKMKPGFNLNLSQGYGFDDDEFVNRLKKLEVPITHSDHTVPFVFHQWHPSLLKTELFDTLSRRNADIFKALKGGY